MIGPYGHSNGSCAGGCARPEYAPYVYQPNPYANTYGVGSPHYGYQSAPNGGYPAIGYSSYNAPVAQSIPMIPALPPAEDILW